MSANEPINKELTDHHYSQTVFELLTILAARVDASLKTSIEQLISLCVQSQGNNSNQMKVKLSVVKLLENFIKDLLRLNRSHQSNLNSHKPLLNYSTESNIYYYQITSIKNQKKLLKAKIETKALFPLMITSIPYYTAQAKLTREPIMRKLMQSTTVCFRRLISRSLNKMNQFSVT